MTNLKTICKLLLALFFFCVCVTYTQEAYATTKSGTTNSTTSDTSINGCGESTSLFSNLLNKGIEIFKGLRELIYVVAGFGVLAVAVGGFFGNLNWKWLGAIIVGLMVIASTGELLTMIVGCETWTAQNITDTLR